MTDHLSFLMITLRQKFGISLDVLTIPFNSIIPTAPPIPPNSVCCSLASLLLYPTFVFVSCQSQRKVQFFFLYLSCVFFGVMCFFYFSFFSFFVYVRVSQSLCTCSTEWMCICMYLVCSIVFNFTTINARAKRFYFFTQHSVTHTHTFETSQWQMNVYKRKWLKFLKFIRIRRMSVEFDRHMTWLGLQWKLSIGKHIEDTHTHTKKACNWKEIGKKKFYFYFYFHFVVLIEMCNSLDLLFSSSICGNRRTQFDIVPCYLVLIWQAIQIKIKWSA